MSLESKAVETGVELLVALAKAAIKTIEDGGSREDAEFEARLAAHRLLVEHGGDITLAAKALAKRKAGS